MLNWYTFIILNLIKIRCYFCIYSLGDASVIFNIAVYKFNKYCYKEKIKQNIYIFLHIKYVTSCTYFFSKHL